MRKKGIVMAYFFINMIYLENQSAHSNIMYNGWRHSSTKYNILSYRGTLETVEIVDCGEVKINVVCMRKIKEH